MDDAFIMPVEVRWSDLDPNFHVRHSVYYDWGAFCRITYLNNHNLSQEILLKYQIGPILFREECIFRKEIRMGEKLNIDLQLVKARKDHSRWTIRHQIIKEDGSIGAIITVDGAWLHVAMRKLTTPPEEAAAVFNTMPRPDDFIWL